MLTVTTLDDKIVSLTVDANELIENVKALLEVETTMPLAQQRLIHNGRDLQNNMSLAAAGVANGDLLMLIPQQAMQPAPSPFAGGGGGGGGNPLGLRHDGTAVDPQALKVSPRGQLIAWLIARSFYRCTRPFCSLSLGSSASCAD